MKRILSTYMVCFLVVAISVAPVSIVPADTTVTTEESSIDSWQAPSPETVDGSIVEWLAGTAESEEQATQWQAQARPMLDRLYSPADRLDAICECLAIASLEVKQLLAECQEQPTDVGSLEWLDSADVPYWMRNNLRLFVGRSLIRGQYYGQALEVLQGLNPQDVYDPASLLFYRSIAEHQLVKIDEANVTLATLLGAKQPLPERFVQVARLMQADIAKVKQDSLNHIARRMSDVERRLSLGETDEKAQAVELGIIESLDKMIEELERQQQQQQQQMAGSQPSGQPMEDSRSAELKGPGKVDPKKIGDGSGWGDLPPRERERVMQQIGRDFPGHYRDLMEEYLKRLATDERENEQP